MNKNNPQIRLYGHTERDLMVGERKITEQAIVANNLLSISLNFMQRHLKKNIQINNDTEVFINLIKS